jgi:hypothetical protein
MLMTPFVCQFTSLIEKLYKQNGELAYNLDAKQFVMAGMDLGRIRELAAQMVGLCDLAKDSLYSDSKVKV